MKSGTELKKSGLEQLAKALNSYIHPFGEPAVIVFKVKNSKIIMTFPKGQLSKDQLKEKLNDALIKASGNNDLLAVKFLLKKRASPNCLQIKFLFPSTPLENAAYHKNAKMAQTLIDAKANIDSHSYPSLSEIKSTFEFQRNSFCWWRPIKVKLKSEVLENQSTPIKIPMQPKW